MADSITFVVITGLSGAGKSYAIKCFEDMGFSASTTCRPP